MIKPLFHTRTESALENYIKRPTHGLILSGSEGTGKYFTALWLAQQLDASAHTIEALDDKNTITIKQIRELYNLTRTGIKMIVIIKEADTMGVEAQNAFLKLLEEPPKNTYFILTSSNAENLLATIKSRTQNITLHNPPQTLLKEYMIQNHQDVDPKEVESLIQTTQGKIGELSTLLESPDALKYHLNIVSDAKNFYTSDKYSRHKICIEHNFEKEWLYKLLELLAVIIQALLKNSTEDPVALKRLNKQAEAIEQTITNITKVPGNTKIHITRLIEVF